MRYPLAATALSLIALPALAQDVKVGGTLEFNYTASFNRPFNNTVPYFFNRQTGQFTLNYGELHVYSDTAKERPTGFSVRMLDGAVVAGLPLNTPGVNTNTTMFYEAYGRVVHEMGGKELTLDAGIFPTHVGYETIPVGTNSFLSKSFHFGQLQPFYHAGFRASIPVGGGATFTGLAFNRYSGVDSNGNSTPGVGFQYSKTLGS
ncbi:MAG: outer membrane beta-barrel protein, partial [Armatimonadaceae bacterium]